MALDNFSVESFALTSRDLVTGMPNTANVYHVEGIARPLSIAELVIAVCLDRAATLEADIVEIMEEMSRNTKLTEDILAFENDLVDRFVDGVPAWKDGTGNFHWADTWEALYNSTESKDWPIPAEWKTKTQSGGAGGWIDYLKEEFGVDISYSEFHKTLEEHAKSDSSKASFTSDDVSSICSAIESRLDALNTTSQEVLIKLQSLTNKRDQTYDLITAMVKSTMTAGQSIGANMR